jgi:hypothetical protein
VDEPARRTTGERVVRTPAEAFDPEDFSVHVQVQPTTLRPSEPDEFVVKHRAQLLPRDAAVAGTVRFPEDDRAIAAIEWERVNVGAAVALGGATVEEVFDAHSQLLFEVYESLFDEDGEVRGELGLEGDGEDVLHIRSLTVAPGHDFGEVGAALLEHVLSFHGSGCFAAVYLLDEVQRVDLIRALVERGFELLKGGRLYLLDIKVA